MIRLLAVYSTTELLCSDGCFMQTNNKKNFVFLHNSYMLLYLPVSLLKLSNQLHGINVQCMKLIFFATLGKKVFENFLKQIVFQKKRGKVYLITEVS